MKIPNVKFLKKKRMIGMGVFALIALFFLVSLQLQGNSSEVTTFTVHRDEFIVDIREMSEIDAAFQVTVSVPDRVYGNVRITKLAEDGSMVKEGDFLVQFDTSESENRVTERLNELENAKAELASTLASIESSMKQLESSYQTQEYSYQQSKLRYEMMKYEAEAKRREEELNFKKSELALQRAKERIETQKIINKTDIAKAETRVRQAEQRYNEAVDQLNALTLKAPRGGLVVLQEIFNWSTRSREKVKVGDQPHRGMDLVSIPDLSVMLAKTKINEVDISKVNVGQKAIITVDALRGSTFYGVVTNVATLAQRDEGSDVKVFDVEITIDDNDPRLKPGMSAQCTIITERIPDQLFVPLESIFTKEGTTVVYVKDGTFKERNIKVGTKNSDYVIIESGIEEGDVVALRDPTIPLQDIGTGETVATSDIGSQNNNH